MKKHKQLISLLIIFLFISLPLSSAQLSLEEEAYLNPALAEQEIEDLSAEIEETGRQLASGLGKDYGDILTAPTLDPELSPEEEEEYQQTLEELGVDELEPVFLPEPYLIGPTVVEEDAYEFYQDSLEKLPLLDDLNILFPPDESEFVDSLLVEKIQLGEKPDLENVDEERDCVAPFNTQGLPISPASGGRPTSAWVENNILKSERQLAMSSSFDVSVFDMGKARAWGNQNFENFGGVWSALGNDNAYQGMGLATETLNNIVDQAGRLWSGTQDGITTAGPYLGGYGNTVANAARDPGRKTDAWFDFFAYGLSFHSNFGQENRQHQEKIAEAQRESSRAGNIVEFYRKQISQTSTELEKAKTANNQEKVKKLEGKIKQLEGLKDAAQASSREASENLRNAKDAFKNFKDEDPFSQAIKFLNYMGGEGQLVNPSNFGAGFKNFLNQLIGHYNQQGIVFPKPEDYLYYANFEGHTLEANKNIHQLEAHYLGLQDSFAALKNTFEKGGLTPQLAQEIGQSLNTIEQGLEDFNDQIIDLQTQAEDLEQKIEDAKKGGFSQGEINRLMQNLATLNDEIQKALEKGSEIAFEIILAFAKMSYEKFDEWWYGLFTTPGPPCGQPPGPVPPSPCNPCRAGVYAKEKTGGSPFIAINVLETLCITDGFLDKCPEFPKIPEPTPEPRERPSPGAAGVPEGTKELSGGELVQRAITMEKKVAREFDDLALKSGLKSEKRTGIIRFNDQNVKVGSDSENKIIIIEAPGCDVMYIPYNKELYRILTTSPGYLLPFLKKLFKNNGCSGKLAANNEITTYTDEEGNRYTPTKYGLVKEGEDIDELIESEKEITKELKEKAEEHDKKIEEYNKKIEEFKKQKKPFDEKVKVVNEKFKQEREKLQKESKAMAEKVVRGEWSTGDYEKWAEEKYWPAKEDIEKRRKKEIKFLKEEFLKNPEVAKNLFDIGLTQSELQSSKYEFDLLLEERQIVRKKIQNSLISFDSIYNVHVEHKTQKNLALSSTVEEQASQSQKNRLTCPPGTVAVDQISESNVAMVDGSGGGPSNVVTGGAVAAQGPQEPTSDEPSAKPSGGTPASEDFEVGPICFDPEADISVKQAIIRSILENLYLLDQEFEAKTKGLSITDPKYLQLQQEYTKKRIEVFKKILTPENKAKLEGLENQIAEQEKYLRSIREQMIEQIRDTIIKIQDTRDEYLIQIKANYKAIEDLQELRATLGRRNLFLSKLKESEIPPELIPPEWAKAVRVPKNAEYVIKKNILAYRAANTKLAAQLNSELDALFERFVILTQEYEQQQFDLKTMYHNYFFAFTSDEEVKDILDKELLSYLERNLLNNEMFGFLGIENEIRTRQDVLSIIGQITEAGTSILPTREELGMLKLVWRYGWDGSEREAISDKQLVDLIFWDDLSRSMFQEVLQEVILKHQAYKVKTADDFWKDYKRAKEIGTRLYWLRENLAYEAQALAYYEQQIKEGDFETWSRLKDLRDARKAGVEEKKKEMQELINEISEMVEYSTYDPVRRSALLAAAGLIDYSVFFDQLHDVQVEIISLTEQKDNLVSQMQSLPEGSPQRKLFQNEINRLTILIETHQKELDTFRQDTTKSILFQEKKRRKREFEDFLIAYKAFVEEDDSWGAKSINLPRVAPYIGIEAQKRSALETTRALHADLYFGSILFERLISMMGYLGSPTPEDIEDTSAEGVKKWMVENFGKDFSKELILPYLDELWDSELVKEVLNAWREQDDEKVVIETTKEGEFFHSPDAQLEAFAVYWNIFGKNYVNQGRGIDTPNDWARSYAKLGEWAESWGDYLSAAKFYYQGTVLAKGELKSILINKGENEEIRSIRQERWYYIAEWYADPLNIVGIGILSGLGKYGLKGLAGILRYIGKLERFEKMTTGGIKWLSRLGQEASRAQTLAQFRKGTWVGRHTKWWRLKWENPRILYQTKLKKGLNKLRSLGKDEVATKLTELVKARNEAKQLSVAKLAKARKTQARILEQLALDPKSRIISRLRKDLKSLELTKEDVDRIIRAKKMTPAELRRIGRQILSGTYEGRNTGESALVTVKDLPDGTKGLPKELRVAYPLRLSEIPAMEILGGEKGRFYRELKKLNEGRTPVIVRIQEEGNPFDKINKILADKKNPNFGENQVLVVIITDGEKAGEETLGLSAMYFNKGAGTLDDVMETGLKIDMSKKQINLYSIFIEEPYRGTNLAALTTVTDKLIKQKYAGWEVFSPFTQNPATVKFMNTKYGARINWEKTPLPRIVLDEIGIKLTTEEFKAWKAGGFTEDELIRLINQKLPSANVNKENLVDFTHKKFLETGLVEYNVEYGTDFKTIEEFQASIKNLPARDQKEIFAEIFENARTSLGEQFPTEKYGFYLEGKVPSAKPAAEPASVAKKSTAVTEPINPYLKYAKENPAFNDLIKDDEFLRMLDDLKSSEIRPWAMSDDINRVKVALRAKGYNEKLIGMVDDLVTAPIKSKPAKTVVLPSTGAGHVTAINTVNNPKNIAET